MSKASLSRRVSAISAATLAAVVAGAGLSVGAAAAGAVRSVLYVSSSSVSDPACALASATNPFATIAAALACSTNGTTVKIGTGVFTGQVSVTHNVILQGAGSATIIRRSAGASSPAADIAVSDGRTVALRSVTVDGNGQATPGVSALGGKLTLSDVTVIGNGDHGNEGGGVSAVPGSGPATVVIVDSTIAGNEADGGGGGIFVDGGATRSTLTVVNSTISGNASNAGKNPGGGGIAIGNASLTVRDSTIADNTSVYSAGGLLADGGNAGLVALTNTIVAANTSSSGTPDCQVSPVRQVTDGGNNLIGQADATGPTACTGFTNGINNDQVGTVATPISPVLGNLANNGGSTPTQALLSGSPAINTGGPTDCQASPVNNTDQRHQPRRANTRSACDIGAYDTGGTPASVLYVSSSSVSDPACALASATNPFATIAAALACSTNGTTVKIGTGVFTGQVSVTHNVILQGAGSATIIRRSAGASSPAADIAVSDGRTVALRSVTVDGNGQATPGVSALGGKLTLSDVTVIGNGDHGNEGGGVSAVPGSGPATVVIVDSTIAGNEADGGGGGIFVDGGATRSTLTVVNSTISGNASNAGKNPGGGGIAIGNASLTVRDSTIADNTSVYSAGGLLADGGNAGLVALTNTIVAANTSSSGTPDCQVSPVRQVTDGGNNLIGQADATGPTACTGFTNGINNDQVGTVATPISPVLGNLANNGGSTPTQALLSGSPAINTGGPTDCQASPVNNTDQRHQPRRANTRSACDIGAYDTGGV